MDKFIGFASRDVDLHSEDSPFKHSQLEIDYGNTKADNLYDLVFKSEEGRELKRVKLKDFIEHAKTQTKNEPQNRNKDTLNKKLRPWISLVVSYLFLDLPWFFIDFPGEK